ncbi:glycosyltransferase family 2 protein [Hydrogenimonas sp. SS33]|uniref:glycosyltransferase family 2 protein n=1 Tax=Hydrogenimonas leucolamina TaxID=2954236 RepID=UPI00336C2426
MDLPRITVVVPLYNEERYIATCLDSILATDYPKEKMEVLLIDGMSEDATREIAEEYHRKFPFIRLIDNPRRIVPVAMNLGIAEATGEYLIRLDAHAEYPTDYFRKLIEWHRSLGADNVGAVIETRVRKETPVAHAIRNVLSDKLGVGSAFRTGVGRPVEADTVPFGCYRMEMLRRLGGYDERLIRNQDIELNKRLIRQGGKVFLVPEIKAVYYAREDFASLAKNNFENGKWNLLTAYYTGTFRSLSPRHFAPLALILGIVLPLPCCAAVSLAVAGIYAAAIFLRSLRIARKTDPFTQMAAFAVLHFSYGIGELAGIMEVLKLMITKKRKKSHEK